MSSYYEDKLYPLQDKVLKIIDSLDTLFYLTGGTALSRCYYNYRYSEDLDFFVNNDLKFMKISESVVNELRKWFNVEIINRSDSFFSLKIESILKLDLINDVKFHFGKFEKKKIFSRVDNVENILSNKLSALISRDEAKDVVDIWVITKSKKTNWRKIFVDANSKAVGIFPPDVASKLLDFPVDLLDRIKWVVGKKPQKPNFKKDIQDICDSMLFVKK